MHTKAAVLSAASGGQMIMLNEEASNWHSVVPSDLIQRAYKTRGELAWSRSDVLRVVGILQDQGYRVIGVDIWIPTHPGPTIPTPLVYDWSEPAYKISAIDFIKASEWDSTDRSHLGREPYFNLTVVG
jgi:hypothetical protein